MASQPSSIPEWLQRFNSSGDPLRDRMLGINTNEEKVRNFLLGKAIEREAVSPRAAIGISPQVETIASFMLNPAATAMDTAISKVQQETERDAAERGINLSMIPTRKNIAAFLMKVMNNKVPAEILKKYPELGTALSLAEARYPMHNANALKYGKLKLNSSPNAQAGTTSGWFDPKNSDVTVVVRPSATSRKPLSADVSPYQNIKDYMSTAIHEMSHSDQWNRKGSRFLKSELLTPDESATGTYITPAASRQAVGDLSLYRSQPVEEDAFRRGDIASKAVSNLVKLLPEQERARIPYDRVPKDLETDMEQVASYFNKAIKLAIKGTPYADIGKKRAQILKNQKESTLWRMKNHQLFEDRFNPTFSTNDYILDPGNLVRSKSLGDLLRNRLVPQAELSPADLKMNAFIRQLQEAKKIDPLTDWLRKSMTIERSANKMPGGLLRHMDELRDINRIK